MKTTKRIFWSLLFLFYPALLMVGPLSAQPYQWTEEQLRTAASFINQSEYLFEGTVLETKNFLDPDGKLLASNRIQIHKVFRGNLKPGTVELISHGWGKFYDPKSKEIQDFRTEHGCGIYKHSTYLFGASARDKHSKLKTIWKTSNPILLKMKTRFICEPLESKGISKPHFAVWECHGPGFLTSDSFYAYLESLPGVKRRDLETPQFRKQFNQELLEARRKLNESRRSPKLRSAPEKPRCIPKPDTAAMNRRYREFLKNSQKKLNGGNKQ